MTEEERNNIQKDDKDKNNKSKSTSVNVVIDRSPEMEELRAQLKKIEEEKNKLAREAEEKLKKANEERINALKKAEEDKINVLREAEKIKKEKEDYENKLKILAEQEFNEKREALLQRAKTCFAHNEDKYKDIEAKLNDPEKGPDVLKSTEYILNLVEDAFKTQREQQQKTEDESKKLMEAQKKAEELASRKPVPREGDTAIFTNGQSENGSEGNINNVEGVPSWETKEAMIRDLYAKKNNTNPINASERAEAEAALKQLFLKWAKDARQKYNSGKPISDDLTKRHERGEYYDEGYSPYNKPEEIKSFKETKRMGI